ncbi:hypothetical protein MFLAVUS_010115 [Mucor flavus]|uniref:Uncharacterized protein n=1 Tax=Mucor flavus TaxID=439312 RepID=A0ABP9ZBT7_9FUNG
MLAKHATQKLKLQDSNQFDVPEKRLENVMSINMLSSYMSANFKYKEGDELIAIAYQICLDLKNEFKDPPQISSYKYRLSIHRALIGKEYALSFESVVQFEDVMTSSVFTIPKKFRLCDSFKDTQECIEAINE